MTTACDCTGRPGGCAPEPVPPSCAGQGEARLLAREAANDARPVPKEAVAESFRAGLERHGADTGPWWERQLSPCRLGTVVQFGWEMAPGDDDGLRWRCEAGRAGAALL